MAMHSLDAVGGTRPDPATLAGVPGFIAPNGHDRSSDDAGVARARVGTSEVTRGEAFAVAA